MSPSFFRRFRRPAACLGLFLATATLPATAATNEYARQVERQLDEAADLLRRQGWEESHDATLGTLASGASTSHTIDLRRHYDYRVLGVCDNDCPDLDLLVQDDDGDTVARDTSTDSVPMVDVSVARSATYRLRVNMHQCDDNPCTYGIAVYRKPN